MKLVNLTEARYAHNYVSIVYKLFKRKMGGQVILPVDELDYIIGQLTKEFGTPNQNGPIYDWNSRTHENIPHDQIVFVDNGNQYDGAGNDQYDSIYLEVCSINTGVAPPVVDPNLLETQYTTMLNVC